VAEGPQEAIAEALEDSLLCIIQRRDFEALLRRKPDLALRVTKFIGFKRKRIESRLEDLVFKDVPGRLAALLLQLAKDYGVLDRRGVLLRIKLSQRELANLIGASREMVNHALSQFRRKRLVDVEGRQIVILSQEALKAIR
ncbi:MAG: Crp/Fnr family transcriptional regulator, partial [Candidatus Methylomirabilales bacterium]